MHTTTLPSPALHDPIQREKQGQCLLVAGGVLLGTIGVFVEEAGQHPLATVWFRCVFGALALGLWAAATRRLGELRLRGRSLGVVGLAGSLMLLNWALFFAAIPRTSIAVATVVFHIQPVWVMVCGAWWLKEAVAPRQWAATLVALGGLALTTGLLEGNTQTMGDGYLLGLLMCLGGSLSYAGVTLIAKTERHVTPFALAWWQCAVGVVVLAWVPWVPSMGGWPTQASSWAWLAGLGVFHTGLAYVLLFTGMARLATGKIAVLQYVYPLTAIGVDRLVYGRTLSAVQVAGVVLMALALWTLRRPQR
ncbi:MAG: DMT family transporter [Rhodoferax sp.]|uniref:DMT family transporter n=2 Tax=Rhodoferax sp. TaxID=50421 RepID=UPI003265D933